jgi:hypothetical protein
MRKTLAVVVAASSLVALFVVIGKLGGVSMPMLAGDLQNGQSPCGNTDAFTCGGTCPANKMCVKVAAGLGGVTCECKPTPQSCGIVGFATCGGPCPKPGDSCQLGDLGICGCAAPGAQICGSAGDELCGGACATDAQMCVPTLAGGGLGGGGRCACAQKPTSCGPVGLTCGGPCPKPGQFCLVGNTGACGCVSSLGEGDSVCGARENGTCGGACVNDNEICGSEGGGGGLGGGGPACKCFPKPKSCGPVGGTCGGACPTSGDICQIGNTGACGCAPAGQAICGARKDGTCGGACVNPNDVCTQSLAGGGLGGGAINCACKPKPNN